MRTAIISANFGGYDPVHRIVNQNQPVDAIMFSDSPIDGCRELGWTNLVLPIPRFDLCSRMRAKYYKLQHHRIDVLKKYDSIIWIDSSIEITSAEYADKMLESSHPGISCFSHPHRSCIYQEAQVLIRSFPHKISGETVEEQVKCYSAEGHPPNFGLTAMTHFVHRMTDESKRVMDEWWIEAVKWSFRDQLSFPVVCRRFGYSPHSIKFDPYSSDLLNWHSHP